MAILMELSELVSLNHTSGRPVYLRLKEDVLLLTESLTHFCQCDEARLDHCPNS